MKTVQTVSRTESESIITLELVINRPIYDICIDIKRELEKNYINKKNAIKYKIVFKASTDRYFEGNKLLESVFLKDFKCEYLYESI